MRKVLYLLAILALTGCKEKYERVIDRYLEDHLKDPSSYQNVEIGKPGIITPMSKAFVETVTEAMKKGDKVSLVGFGTFEKTKREAREGINPATKQKIKIAASYSPKFKAGKALKDAMN